MTAPINPYATLSGKIKNMLSAVGLQFPRVETLDDLLDALRGLEVSVYRTITEGLRRYDPDRKIKDQKDHSRTLLPLSHALFQAYYLVSSDRAAMTDVTKLLGPVAGQVRFGINKLAKPQVDSQLTSKLSDPCSMKQAEFAHALSQVVLVCLAASGRTKAGALLLTALVKSKAVMTVQPAYKERRTSLLMVETPVQGVYCSSLAPTADLRTRLERVQPPKPDGERHASTFSAPVWLDDPKLSAGELAYLSFSPGPGELTVEEALTRVLTGSVSFDAEFRPFYNPPRLDVLHEVAHAIHNANGENRKSITLEDADRDLWDDGEEAWTIAFDPIGQNAQASDIGVPAALGHSGLYLADLVPGTEVSDLTLREISRNPHQPTTDKKDNCNVM
jgi:hypothetical protein